MTELARGTVLDRPWGRTLAALGLRGLTGEVTLTGDGKPFLVAFEQGVVVASSSPLGSDAAVRVALTSHLISSTQVAEIVRKQAAAPQREEIDALAEAARLAPEQAHRLRRRVIAQRAARTFSVERGEFIVDDRITLPVVPGSELDVRTIVYLGAKQFLSETRLNGDLGQLGAWFQLKPEAHDDLPQFGFGDAEYPVIERLRNGAGLMELETPELEQRMVRAVVYALVCCNMCVVEAHARPVVKAPRARPQDSVDAPTLRRPEPREAPTERRATAPSPKFIDAPTAVGRKKPASQAPAEAPTTRRKADAQTLEVEALIQARLAVLDTNPDHYTLIGVPRDATAKQIRTAYLALARQLHPDRLKSLDIPDDDRRAQRLFAEVNTAFSTLSDPKLREEYTSVLQRGGAAAIRAEQSRAEDMTQRVLDSEEAYRKGELALKRDQITTAIRELERAVDLNPDEADYHATLAWARFCASSDKMAAAQPTRVALDKAIRQSPKAVTARFYLGRVERMLGKDADALKHFRDVLAVHPNHSEATSEVRVLESRLGGDKGGGLFGRPKR
ncbi:MAG: heat shock protein DnaJ domain protein [Myxococcales bacterium]|nr:heat shock protein DnaJ domain protein [Myxococcales bacterium]